MDGASEQVAELKSLYEVGVPDHATVLDANIGEGGVDLVDLLDTLVERFLGTEDGDIGLHNLLHGQADFSGRLGTIGVADLVENGNRIGTSVSRYGVSLLTGAEVVADGVGNGAAEDDKIEEGVGTKTVGTVDGDGGGFTTGEQTWDDLVVTLGILSDDLTSVLGGNTTHVIVDGGQYGNGLLCNVDTSENRSGLRDTRQTLVENFRWQMAELEVDVVLLRPNTTSLTNLESHGSGDDVAGGKILGGWRITLHKPFAFRVEQVTTLTTRSLGDQAASAVDTSRVELDEFEILVGQTSTSDHSHTITGTGVGRCAAEVGTSVSSGSQDSVLRNESVDSAVFLVVCDDTLAFAVLHDQISGEVFDEVLSVVS